MREKLRIGKVLRAMGCMLMAALLFFSPFSVREEGTSPASGEWEPVSVPPEEVHLRMLNAETLAVLVACLSEANVPDMIFLFVADRDGDLRGVTLPPQTRVLVDVLSENGECVSSSYASLSDAYSLGSTVGLGFENLTTSVSRLFAGAPIDGCIAVNSRGAEQLIDNMGGAYVRYDHFSALTGGVVGDDDTKIRLNGKKAYAYAKSVSREVDVGALSRQQEILLAIRENMSKRETPYSMDKLLEDAHPWIYTNLSQDRAERLFSAINDYAAEYVDGSGSMEILWGENRIIDGIPYRLPDKNAIKSFVLAVFYPDSPGEIIYGNAE